MIKSAKGVIFFKNNYLLQLRDNEKNIYFPNFWGLFGGQIEKTETCKKALEREIKEETNLIVKATNMILSVTCKMIGLKNKTELIYYECKILGKRKIAEFFAGDTIKIGVRIFEGKRERIQYFEGVCIAKKNRNINSSFTVRKISFGEGVERTFALYSSVIGSIKLIRSGKVKRAKLYYLRDRKGKSARILERIKKNIGIDVSEQVSENEIVKDAEIVENKLKTELKKEELKKEKK